MIKTDRIFFTSLLTTFLLISCGDNDEDNNAQRYDEWTVTGSGLNAELAKNVLTEFVGSTNCPYCPAADSLLLTYFEPTHDNYVGASIEARWHLINYHTYSPFRGDPMYEFHRGATAEEDYCYVRFEEGTWYTIGGVPTIYTNGTQTYISENMASGVLSDTTPLQISLDATIDGSDIEVTITINSTVNLTSENSLYLFIAATLDNVDYTGYNDLEHHQDVFLGWITEGLGGELLSITNEEKAKTYTWQMPSNWPENSYETTWSQVGWDPANLQVVAFIQNQSTKEILQVAGTK